MPIALITGGASVLTGLLGSREQRKQRKQAEQQANSENALAERQLGLLETQNQQQQDRFNSIYAPIENSIAGELQQGPDLEGAARTAGDEFSGQFDIAQDAQERNLRQFGIRPGSSQFARATEDAAFNRAAGTAAARNQARNAEDDQHFLQQMSFLGGGSGIQGQVAQGMQSIYNVRADRAGAYATDANAAAVNQGRHLSNAINSAAPIISAGYDAYKNNQQATNSSASNTGVNSNNSAKAMAGYGHGPSTDNPIRDIRKETY